MIPRAHAVTARSGGDTGFTLIELLVVVIIIGILAAIAIPIYLHQKQKAVDASIKADLQSVAQAEETYAVDHQNDPAGPYTMVPGNLGVRISAGNTIGIWAAADGFCVSGANPKSSATGGSYFWYDSALGGLHPGGADPNRPTAGGVCEPAWDTTFPKFPLS